MNTYTFPCACPQIIFHKQEPLYIPELDTVQNRLTISGQVNSSYTDGRSACVDVFR